MERMLVLVEGVVQGVGFRFFVRTTARELGLTGYTENLADGRVRTVAEGERDRLERLYSALQRGPEGARVTHYTVSWLEATGEFDSFSIRR